MTDHLLKYGFTIYDTSNDLDQVLDSIVNDIKTKLELLRSRSDEPFY